MLRRRTAELMNRVVSQAVGMQLQLSQRGSRMIGTLKLMGEHAFVPDGIPLKMLPGDAGRWWLEDGGVVDRAAAGIPR